MNKNITALILIVLAGGIYFTFTKAKIAELKSIQQVNAQYEQALLNAEKLVKLRDKVLAQYNNIPAEDRERLDKMLPDNVDNVRLIIDTNGVAARHNLRLQGIKTSAGNAGQAGAVPAPDAQISGLPTTYDTVTVSFGVTTDYQTFIAFLRDLEASLRIMDVSKITLAVADEGKYNYSVELKTYWLKQ